LTAASAQQANFASIAPVPRHFGAGIHALHSGLISGDFSH
jgi:hypothetical protein